MVVRERSKIILASPCWGAASAPQNCTSVLVSVDVSDILSFFLLFQHQTKGNNHNPDGHLMQHICCAYVDALLSATVELAL